MVTGSDVGDALTDGVDGSRDVQADAAGQVAGEQPPAQRPVGRVEPDGVNGDADTSRAGFGHDGVLHAEHVRGLAVLMEPDRSHRRRGRGIGSGHGGGLQSSDSHCRQFKAAV